MHPDQADSAQRNFSVKGRLIILLLVMILPFIAFSAYKAIDINNNLETEAKTSGLALAKNIAHDIDDYITSTGEVLIPIASNKDVRAQNLPAVKAWLETVVPKYPFYHLIAFVDTEGNIKAAAMSEAMTKSEDAQKVNVRDTACYTRAMASGGIAVGDFMYSKLTGMPVVHVTYPVFDYSGKRVGFIAAAFDLTKLQNKLMYSGVDDHTVITIMDDKGIVIARSIEPEKWVGKNLSKQPGYVDMQGKTEGMGRVAYADGTTRLFGFAATAKVPWFVRAGVDESYIEAQVGQQLLHHFTIFLPLLLVAIFGWLWIGRDVNRLHKRTEYLTLIDPLTELWNYRKLGQDLDYEIRRVRRSGQHVSFIMIDIDHFKNYNDHNGHQLGDETLRAVSDTVRNAVRDIDSVYRCGGEEMCVLLPETGKDGALAVAERIRADIERTHFAGEEHQPSGRLTVSLGVSTYPVDSISKEGLLKSADVALYRAKELGRNRVEDYVQKTHADAGDDRPYLGQCV